MVAAYLYGKLMLGRIMFENLPNPQMRENRGHLLELCYDAEEIDEIFEKALRNKIKIMQNNIEQPWSEECSAFVIRAGT